MSQFDTREITAFGVTRPMLYRPGTADELVLAEVFDRGIYDLTRFDWWAALAKPERPHVIDAGAHIGAFSVFASLLLPGAEITAFEPERGNFNMLMRNRGGLRGNFYMAGVAADAGWGVVLDPGAGNWGYQAVPRGMRPNPLLKTVPLMSLNGFPPAFLVKLDIEGGEEGLFDTSHGGDCAWLDATPVVLIELHDGAGDTFRMAAAERKRHTWDMAGGVTCSVREDLL